MPSDEMPDVFDHLRDKVAVWAEKYPGLPDFELHSDRVVEAQDDDCRVWVAIKDFEVSSIRVDAFWWGQHPSLADVEEHIREAVNTGLRRYWDEELEAAQDSSVPMGEIDVFLRAVGHSPAEGNPASVEILELLGTDFEEETLDKGDGRESTYWSFHDVGTQLVWRRKTLTSVSLFVQGDEGNGFLPYPRHLFDAFKNEVTKSDVQQTFGTPDTSGMWNGEWIRYDNVNGTELRFEFDENDHLWSVGVTMKDWQDF